MPNLDNSVQLSETYSVLASSYAYDGLTGIDDTRSHKSQLIFLYRYATLADGTAVADVTWKNWYDPYLIPENVITINQGIKDVQVGDTTTTLLVDASGNTYNMPAFTLGGGQVFEIQRSQDVDNRVVIFGAGSRVTAQGLNNAVDQLFKSVQELDSRTTIVESGETQGGGTGGGSLTPGNYGDVIVNVDGSFSVVDDSHNHVISNVDGLQAALDAKLTGIVAGTNVTVSDNGDGTFTVNASASSGGVEEAPNDGQQYARESEGWSVVTGGGIALTDLSVDTINPASTTVSSLSYDNTAGEFNFTPVDVTGKAEAQTLTQSGGTITGTIDTSTGVFSLTAPSSGGGDALTTADLGQFDTVDLTGLVDGNVLKWDNVNSMFEPFEINYTTLPGTPTLSNVALTGDYGDLNDRPLFVGTGSVTITETSASGQTTYTIDGTSTGSGAVNSVNGATGTVVLSGDDIDTTATSGVTVTSTVNAAVSTAISANTTANGANTTANAAQTDATQALSDAATAQSAADAVALEVDNFQGGTSGQVFVKDTATDYDGTWTTLPTVTGVPADTGSTSGDVLSTDGSGVYTWETPAGTSTTPTNLTYTASTGVLTSSTQNNSGATIPEATTSDRGLMSSADKVRFDDIPAATAGSNGQVLSTDGSAYGWTTASGGSVTEDAVRLTNTVGAAGFYTIGGIPKTAGFTPMMVMDSAAGGVFWLSETSNVYLMNRNFLNSVSTSGFTTQQVEELEQTKKFMDAYGMASVEIDLNNSDIKIVYVSTTEAALNMAALPSQDIRLSYSGSSSGSTVLFTLNDYKSQTGATVRYGVSSGLIDTAVASLGSGATRIVWESGVLPVTGIVQYDADGFTAGVVNPTDIISVAIEAPSAKAYAVVLKMPHSGEVTEINTKLNAGTCDVQVSFGGTDLLASAQSTSSTLATGTSFSAASFEAGDEVIVTVSNLGGSSDEDLTVSMSYNIVY